MSPYEVLYVVGWVMVLGAYIVMAVYRKPLARWLVPRNPFWRDRPHAERVYEVTFVFAATVVVGGSLVVLYQNWWMHHRLQQEIRETERAIRELSVPSAKPN